MEKLAGNCRRSSDESSQVLRSMTLEWKVLDPELATGEIAEGNGKSQSAYARIGKVLSSFFYFYLTIFNA